jgi:transcriptional regulator with XRE-family HTH domain
VAEIVVQVFFREWRKAANLTQQEVAEALKSKRQTVSRIEKGDDFAFSYLVAFSNLVGCHYTAPITRPPDKERLT